MFQVYVFYECVLDVLCIYLVTDAGSCADRYTDTSCLCINTSDRVNFYFLLLLWDLKTRFVFFFPSSGFKQIPVHTNSV